MIAGIVTRIEESTGDAFKVVAGAAEYAAILGKTPQRHNTPAAYVVPLREKASANQRAAMMVVQKKSVRFGVVLVLPATADVHGEAAMAALKAPRDALTAALVAWTPPGMDDVVTFDEGRLQLIQNGFLWWLDSFLTEEAIRVQQQS